MSRVSAPAAPSRTACTRGVGERVGAGAGRLGARRRTRRAYEHAACRCAPPRPGRPPCTGRAPAARARTCACARVRGRPRASPRARARAPRRRLTAALSGLPRQARRWRVNALGPQRLAGPRRGERLNCLAHAPLSVVHRQAVQTDLERSLRTRERKHCWIHDCIAVKQTPSPPVTPAARPAVRPARPRTRSDRAPFGRLQRRSGRRARLPRRRRALRCDRAHARAARNSRARAG